MQNNNITYIIIFKTRMSTSIKMNHRKSDDQTKIIKYRVAANIIEYHIISKSIFRRIIFPNFMMIKQLFLLKHVCNNVKTQHF